MHARLIPGLLLWLVANFASAALYNYSSTPNQTIEDNHPSGYVNSLAVSGVADSVITRVSVRLQISGGWNGDLYVTLVHDNSPVAVLLNRVGMNGAGQDGFGDAGFDIWLSDDGANGDIHVLGTGGSPLTGAWQPDGRTADPDAVTHASARGGMLNVFNGLNPNGQWTLFAADLSPGSESTLVSWELEIQAVPEPVTLALAVFGLCGLAWVMARRYRKTTPSLPPK